eukprot:398539_1
MSTFYEEKVKTQDVTCLCWKQRTPSYLAVGTTKGLVEFYWSDCTECNFPTLSFQSRTSKTAHVTSLTFHPICDILIAIWSNGVIRSWNSNIGTISNQMSAHSVENNSYLNVLFNENGTRLITGDYRGVISIWSCNNNGLLNLLYTFKLNYGCEHIVNANNENGFFISNNEGKIYLATDKGYCNDILELEKTNNEKIHLRLLQFISKYNNLIFITEDMILYIYNMFDFLID